MITKWTIPAQMIDPPARSYASEINHAFHQRVVACGKSAIGVPAAQLTEDQRFSVAVAAGVECRPVIKEGTHAIVMQTEPCGIADDDKGGFIVATLAKEHT